MTANKLASSKTNGHQSGDDRFSVIDRTMKRFKYEKDSLLEVLNSAQESFGYLSKDLLFYISNQLQVPMSRVYGVATFYHMFTFVPLGEHNCIVCNGTACHVKGSDRIINSISEEFSVKAGGATSDNLLSLNIARCLGSCGLAPVVVFDGEVSGKQTPEAVTNRIREIISISKEMYTEKVEAG